MAKGPRKYKTKGTYRQKKAVEILVENGGNVSKAMLEAGYPPATAHTPQKLTESSGFAALMETMLPDDMLLKIHCEGLQATERDVVYVTKGKGKKAKTVAKVIRIPDFHVRHRYLDTAYKIKGKITKKDPDLPPINLNFPGVRARYS
jgi:hypothetical protein